MEKLTPGDKHGYGTLQPDARTEARNPDNTVFVVEHIGDAVEQDASDNDRGMACASLEMDDDGMNGGGEIPHAVSGEARCEDPALSKEEVQRLRVQNYVLKWKHKAGNPRSRSYSKWLEKIDAFIDPTDPRPPDVEFLFVENMAVKGCHWTELLRFGHAAIRYTLPNGEQYVVNIFRPTSEHKLLEFYENPADYMIGVNGRGGIHSRDMCGVRIEKVDPSRLWAMHRQFESISHQFGAHLAGFVITSGIITGWMRSLLRLDEQKLGNCARWTGRGLTVAGLIARPSMWPKSIWVELLERHSAKDVNNVHVVYYKRLNYRVKEKANLKTIFSLCRLADITRSIYYFNLEKHADVIVDNDENEHPGPDGDQKELQLRLVKGPREPHAPNIFWRFHAVTFWILLFGFYLFYRLLFVNWTDTGPDIAFCRPESWFLRAIIVAAIVGVFQFALY